MSGFRATSRALKFYDARESSTWSLAHSTKKTISLLFYWTAKISSKSAGFTAVDTRGGYKTEGQKGVRKYESSYLN
jgi:hypothetical protein